MHMHARAEGACYSADIYYVLLYHHLFHKTYMRNFHNYYLSGKNSFKNTVTSQLQTLTYT